MEFLRTHWFLITMLVIATALSFVWLYVFNRNRLSLRWWECLVISLLSLVLGLLSTIILHFVENGFDFSNFGTSAYGAIFVSPLVALLASVILRKDNFVEIADALSILVAIFLILARVNCLRAGCCHGIKLGNTDFRWPARELDILFQIMFIVAVTPLIVGGKREGLWMPIYFISYGLFRFVNEWLRETETPRLMHDGHIWSLIAIASGITWVMITVVKSKKGRSSENESNY